MATPPKGFQFENPQLFQDLSGDTFSVLSNLGQPDRAWSGLENVALEPIDTTGGGTGGGGGGDGGGTFGNNPPGTTIINGPPPTDGGGGGTTDTGGGTGAPGDGGGGFGGAPTTITGAPGGGGGFDATAANNFMAQMGQSPLTPAELQSLDAMVAAEVLTGGGTGIGTQGQSFGPGQPTNENMGPLSDPNAFAGQNPPTQPTPPTPEGFPIGQISPQQIQDINNQLAEMGLPALTESEVAALSGALGPPSQPNNTFAEEVLSAEGKVSATPPADTSAISMATPNAIAGLNSPDISAITDAADAGVALAEAAADPNLSEGVSGVSGPADTGVGDPSED